MKIVYLKGKRATFGFMPFGKVIFPESVEMYSKKILQYINDDMLRFYKHEVSLKAAIRRIKQQKYEKGTVVHLTNWYVDYADILVYI